MNEKIFQALLAPRYWSGVKTSKNTVKRFKRREERKIRQKKILFFYFMAEVKRNVEGNIHLAFYIVVLVHLKQYFTLESVLPRHEENLCQWRRKSYSNDSHCSASTDNSLDVFVRLLASPYDFLLHCIRIYSVLFRSMQRIFP